MKAPLSFVILITIFSEPFFTVGSPQHLDINEQLSATHPNEETDRSGGRCPNCPKCQTIEVTLKGDALVTHGGGSIASGSFFGPFQGFYNISWSWCGKQTWYKPPFRHGQNWHYYQRIWWHAKKYGDSECGKKVSKGHDRDYWRIGNFDNGEHPNGLIDTYDYQITRLGMPYAYDHRQAVWSYWKLYHPEINGNGTDGWVGPTRDIDVNCVSYGPRPRSADERGPPGDGPFEKEGEV